MIRIEDAYNLMITLKTPHLSISDFNGNKIMVIDYNDTPEQTIEELKELVPMFTNYGKINIRAGTDAIKKGLFSGAFKWVVFFDKPVAQANQNFAGHQWQQNQYQQPANYVHNDVVKAQIDLIKAQMDFKFKEMEMAHKKEGPEQYIPFMPYIMSALGKSDEQIGSMMKWHAVSGSMGFKQGELPTNTLTFSDVEKMSDKQKNEKIEKLMSSLATKVSAEHMILLLEAIDKKPELALKAVNLLPML